MKTLNNIRPRINSISLKQTIFTLTFLICSLCHLNAQKQWSLDASVSGNLGAGVYISAIESVAFFNGTNLQYYPIDGSETSNGSLTAFDGFPANWSTITASMMWDESTAMLFNGIDYITLNVNDATLSEVFEFPGLPANWNGRLDGAVNWGEGNYLFFSGLEFTIYNANSQSFEGSGNISQWEGWPGNWNAGVDAVINPGDGFVYFFNKNEYISYNLYEGRIEGGINKMATAAIMLPPGIKKNIEQPSQVANVQESVVEDYTSKGLNTDGWCLTGTPSGYSESDLAADVIHMEKGGEGTESSDDVPQGARVAEIRVWGSWVIIGLQTVLQTTDGEMLELPVLGEKKGKTNVFKLQPDECITGISGTHYGPAGNFIQTLKIETSKRKSKSFGNSRGQKLFSVDLPAGTSFFGFSVNANNYLSSIGVQYVGYEDQMIQQQTSIDESENVTASNDINKQGEWRDDYEDFSNELIDLQFAAAGEGQLRPLPTIEWIGKGVDILTLDPLNIGTSPTVSSPVYLTTSKQRGGETNDNLIPYGTEYTTMSSGKAFEEDKMLETYKDFTTNFGTSVSVSVGVSKIGGGSLSGSYKQMNNSKFGSQEIYYAKSVEREMFKIKMKMLWREQSANGAKYRQKLDYDFRDLVDNLPVPNRVPNVDSKNMRKGKKLPSQIEKIRSAYEQIINRFGTHFINEATFGGKYVRNTKITKMDYETTRQTEMEFKASAKAKIKVVDIGADVEFKYGTKNVSGKKSSHLTSHRYVQGASGETEFETWNTSLTDRPAPIKVFLTATYELLREEFFPNDPDIEKKMAILKMVTEQYQLDEYLPPTESPGGFFSAPKPIDYKYTLTVNKITCTGIDSDEPGSSNEFFGYIQCYYSQKPGSLKNVWTASEDETVDLTKGNSFPIVQGMTIKLKEGAEGYFRVTGFLTERDDWPNGDDFLGMKYKDVKVADVLDISELDDDDEAKNGIYKVAGFSNAGDRAEIEFKLTKSAVF